MVDHNGKRIPPKSEVVNSIDVVDSDPFAHLDLVRTPSGSVKDVERLSETNDTEKSGALKHLPQNLDVIFEEEDQSYDENDLVDDQGQFIIFTSPEEEPE